MKTNSVNSANISINDARAIAREVASRYTEPTFKRDHEDRLRLSWEILESERLVRQFREHLIEIGNEMGHGLVHSELVAIDAGAIVAIEWQGETDAVRRLMVLAQIAGLLHDIRRKEKDHAQRGAEAANDLLRGTSLNERERLYITTAIRNHEAFKEQVDTFDDSGRLLSDALYDADKFRWGPDNFTTTLWDMLEYMGVDLAPIFTGYHESVKGIVRVKETFRTETGKRYGPEFIDLGLKIGEEAYEILLKMKGSGD